MTLPMRCARAAGWFGVYLVKWAAIIGLVFGAIYIVASATGPWLDRHAVWLSNASLVVTGVGLASYFLYGIGLLVVAAWRRAQ